MEEGGPRGVARHSKYPTILAKGSICDHLIRKIHRVVALQADPFLSPLAFDFVQ